MKRNVPVVKLCLYVSECVCSKTIKELPGLVGSGTPYIYLSLCRADHSSTGVQLSVVCLIVIMNLRQ